MIAVDTFLTASNAKADVVLAACAFGEKDGTTTNLEGRVNNVVRQVSPAGNTRPDWMIAVGLAQALGGDLGYSKVDEITLDIAINVPGFELVTTQALKDSADGVLAGTPTEFPAAALLEGVAPERNSYDLRLVVSRTLYDLSLIHI